MHLKPLFEASLSLICQVLDYTAIQDVSLQAQVMKCYDLPGIQASDLVSSKEDPKLLDLILCSILYLCL